MGLRRRSRFSLHCLYVSYVQSTPLVEPNRKGLLSIGFRGKTNENYIASKVQGQNAKVRVLENSNKENSCRDCRRGRI